MRNKFNRNIFIYVIFAVLALYVLSMCVLFLWSFVSSLKSRINFVEDPIGLPIKWMFSNYEKAFKEIKVLIPDGDGVTYVKIFPMIVNSLLYSIGSTLVNVFVTCVMAYVVARYEYKMSKVIYSIVIVAMILPVVGALPSQIQIVKALGLYNKLIGLYIMNANFLGLYFLIFYAQFKGFDKGYSEAAFVDGASHYTVLFRIMLPLVMTTFYVICLLQFIGMWNDYMTPLVFMSSRPTLAYGLLEYQLSNANSVDSVPMKLAGCMILTLPILVLYLLFQDKMMGNLTVGGLKG